MQSAKCATLTRENGYPEQTQLQFHALSIHGDYKFLQRNPYDHPWRLATICLQKSLTVNQFLS